MPRDLLAEKISSPRDLLAGIKQKSTLEEIGDVVTETVKDMPRQAALSGRFVLEGLGGTADLVTKPLQIVYNPIAEATGLPKAGGNPGQEFSDYIGLPTPQNKLERVAGDITRTLYGTAGVIGTAAKAANAVPGVSKEVLKVVASRPDLQAAAAAGSGAAGGSVRESGGGPVLEFLASLSGGVGAAGALSAGQKGLTVAKDLVDRLKGSPNLDMQIDVAIQNAVKSSGMALSDLPTNVVNQLRSDIRKAVSLGELSPDAARRLADYRLIGATPTAANLTLEPAAITQQRNLAKMGANSQDPSLQRLSQIQNENNSVLIDRLNDAGAGTDPMSASQTVIGSLSRKNEQAKGAIDAAYKEARATDGRSASLDPSSFAQKANDLLDEALLGGKLPADVRNIMNQIASGKSPFTVDVAEQLKTRIGELQRASMDGSERRALGLVRQAIEESPLLDGQGQQAINAFNKARAFNKAWMDVVDRTPALQAVRDGVEPDKFVQNFVIGSGKDSSTNSLFNLKKQLSGDDEAITAVKGSITNYLKSKALSGASDEVGNFSQAGYNRALNSIGEKKLSMFFSPLEVQQLKAIGRVASYEQVQPVGSAVNNSNTSTTLVSTLLDRVGNSPLLRKIPLGAEILGDPLKSVSANVKATRALNVPKSIVNKKPEARRIPPVLIPLLVSEDQ